MFPFNPLVKLFTLILSIALMSCSSKELPPGDYDAAEVGKVKKVISGTILSARPVRLHNENIENLTLQPDNPHLKSLNDTGITKNHGFEYVIRLQSGHIISVVQADTIQFKPKQHVLIIYGKNTRIMPDNGGGEDY